MKIRASVLASALLLACLACGAAGASDYEIRLHRPAAVGHRYRVVAKGSDEQSMAMRVDGQGAPPRGERMAVELAADCEALAVTASGRETRVRLTIEKLTRVDGAAPVELLPPGSVVVGEQAGAKTNFTVGGSPASELVTKALETAGISASGDAHPNDDVVFGTSERKKVGDSWPIHTEAAAADLAKSGIPAEAGALTGTTTLVEATKADGQPVLRIAGTLAMSDVKLPLPPGVTVKKAEFKGSLSGLFPVDLAKPAQQASATMVFEVAAAGLKDGKSLELTMSKKVSRESNYTEK